MMAGDAQDELEEIKKREEDAFAQALGYSMPAIVKKSIPKISQDELKKVILDESQDNYNDQQGGLGYSAASLRDFKDSIKDHLDVPIQASDKNKGTYSESKRKSESSSLKSKNGRDHRNVSKSPTRHRRHGRSPSPPYSQRKHKRSHSRDKYDRKDQYQDKYIGYSRKRDSRRSP